MNARTLKIVLAVSVALNLFAVVAGASLWVGLSREQGRIEAQHRPPRTRSTLMLIDQLDPAVRDRVRDALRASAMAARPDFEEARLKRREAVQMVRAGTFDAARTRGLLEESRAAELRGRARLEADAVTLLTTLEPDDRQALSEILTRRGRGAGRDRGPRPAGG
ncbi:MAG: periplasmic heavy metal sensor [Brevundimonas sp.]|uniref:periplasmic heavy metal sensor n=1 Tax=Brevundimonas sp. TaxID=1871086 RepID=UPI00271C6F9C|nr:periplasmic heavy metal sensor [Brevundimonas sp.]MDO9586400.1 periplasmic heavy metal sensor [Brevundimonas sp.]MDP3369926.1 periplasmic heavy metal sensor [Brevundimonas sp.]